MDGDWILDRLAEFVMSFTGVTVITDGKLCTTSAVDANTDSGYHLVVVKDYSRTVQEIPNGESITSGPFKVGGYNWYIGYSPNGADQSHVDCISFCISLDDDNEEDVEMKFMFSTVDQVEKQNPRCIRAAKTYKLSSEDIVWVHLKRPAYLKADYFTIRCDIMVCNDLNAQEVGGSLPDIGEHFKVLLQDKVGSDVTFEVSGETFTAHRCVLAAGSKVFKAQLFGPMMEGITPGIIHIKDMGAKVFAALLSFIYSDSFPKMEEEKAQAVEGEEEEAADVEGEGQEEEAIEVEMPEVEEEGQEDEVAEHGTWLQWPQDLFVAADRYDVQQLKFICEKKLSKHIGVSSVASTLALAEQHHCHGLKKACLNFIQVQSPKCLGKVMATDDWKHISTTYPSVLDELIVKLVSDQKNDKRKR